MSAKIMGLVFDIDNKLIGRDEKYILVAYADHADHEGGSVFPAVSTIAEKTGYSERSVQNITRQLTEKGFLVPEGKGPKGTNKWRIDLYAGVQNLRGAEFAGVQSVQEGVQPSAPGGAIATAPEPSLTVIKPSEPHVSAAWDIAHGKTPVLSEGEKNEILYKKISERLEVGLRRYQFPQSVSAQAVYRWIAEREAEGQSLDRFIAWATRDDRAMQYTFIYHKDPALIKRDWPQAFGKSIDSEHHIPTLER